MIYNVSSWNNIPAKCLENRGDYEARMLSGPAEQCQRFPQASGKELKGSILGNFADKRVR
jgi:hypothetical protein